MRRPLIRLALVSISLFVITGWVNTQPPSPTFPPPQVPDGFRQIDPPPSIDAPRRDPIRTRSDDDDEGQPREWVSNFVTFTASANNASQLLSAVTYSNNNPTQDVVVYLNGPSTITITQPIVVSGTLTIRGLDSTGLFPAEEGDVKIKMSSTGNGGRLFTVNSGATLVLHDVTLTKGRPAAAFYPGGAILANGSIELYNTKLVDNAAGASNYGGGIYVSSSGSLTMSNVVVKKNTSGYGGAISVFGGAAKIKKGKYGLRDRCVAFKENSSSTNGGVIYGSASSSTDVKRGVYYLNSSPAYKDIFNNTTGNVISAKKSRWRWQWMSVSGGVDVTGYTFDPTLPPPGSVPGLEEETDCGVPQPPDTPERIQQQLSNYGITIYLNGVAPGQSNGQAWTIEELRELKRAVELTASAFNRFKYQDPSGTNFRARTLFKNVMQYQGGGSVANLLVLRTTNSFAIGDPVCDITNNAGCTSNDFNAILLKGNFYINIQNVIDISVGHYTIIHEFGHRFDNQSHLGVGVDRGKNLYDRAYGWGHPPNPDQRLTTVIGDCSIPAGVVMGRLGSNPDNWLRGSRGWGDIFPTTPPYHSNFQQNIVNAFPDTEKEVREAVADLFLNWVYRRTTDLPPTGNKCQYNLPVTWKGFQNIQADGSSDSTKSGNSRYWWMETQIYDIFAMHPTWQ